MNVWCVVRVIWDIQASMGHMPETLRTDCPIRDNRHEYSQCYGAFSRAVIRFRFIYIALEIAQSHDTATPLVSLAEGVLSTECHAQE